MGSAVAAFLQSGAAIVIGDTVPEVDKARPRPVRLTPIQSSLVVFVVFAFPVLAAHPPPLSCSPPRARNPLYPSVQMLRTLAMFASPEQLQRASLFTQTSTHPPSLCPATEKKAFVADLYLQGIMRVRRAMVGGVG